MGEPALNEIRNKWQSWIMTGTVLMCGLSAVLFVLPQIARVMDAPEPEISAPPAIMLTQAPYLHVEARRTKEGVEVTGTLVNPSDVPLMNCGIDQFRFGGIEPEHVPLSLGVIPPRSDRSITRIFHDPSKAAAVLSMETRYSYTYANVPCGGVAHGGIKIQ